MSGDMVNILFLAGLMVAAIVCIFGPLTVLSVMFWKWHKELRQSSRLRLARSTHVR
jgi:hypothetical protein